MPAFQVDYTVHTTCAPATREMTEADRKRAELEEEERKKKARRRNAEKVYEVGAAQA